MKGAIPCFATKTTVSEGACKTLTLVKGQIPFSQKEEHKCISSYQNSGSSMAT